MSIAISLDETPVMDCIWGFYLKQDQICNGDKWERQQREIDKVDRQPGSSIIFCFPHLRAPHFLEDMDNEQITVWAFFIVITHKEEAKDLTK